MILSKKNATVLQSNLIPILIDPNDISSTANSDVDLSSRTQFIFTIYKGL